MIRYIKVDVSSTWLFRMLFFAAPYPYLPKNMIPAPILQHMKTERQEKTQMHSEILETKLFDGSII
jgi:hypothetical protein